MPYALEPLVAGELGEGTELDTHEHPPLARKVEYVLDAPVSADLIESFPVFLVSVELAQRLQAAHIEGFALDEAKVVASREYEALHEQAPHKEYLWLRLTAGRDADCWLDDQYRLCVSDRMFEVLQASDLEGCEVEPVAEPS
jgi:hypothetical protein